MKRFGAVLGPILIIAAVAFAWTGSFAAPFELDDNSSIIDNASIRHLWPPDWLRPPATAGETVSGRPVLNLSFALNAATGGADVRGYHAVNVLVHALAALVLFGLVRRTLAQGKVTPPTEAAGLATAVALLWAVHPLQTEAVTYVVQRAESLAALFYLLTLYCFIRGIGVSAGPGTGAGPGQARCGRRWFGLAVASCLLGAGTKETIATAPLVVLLYDRALVAGSFAAAWRARGRVHLALMATWLPLAALVLANHGRGGSAGAGAAVGAWSYLLTQCGAIVRYLRLAFWPAGQVFDYGVVGVSGIGAVWPQALLLAGAGALALWALGRNRSTGFLGAGFFLLLAPSSSVLPVATQTMAEHRMYLALAPVIALVVLLIRAIGRRIGAPAWSGIAAAALVVVALAVTTHARNRAYRSALALWSDTAAKWPGNPRAHHNLGVALLETGKFDDAAQEFQRAIALEPAHALAHYELGTIFLRRGEWAEAATEFAAALAAAPRHVAARLDLALALGRLGRTEEAIAQDRAVLAVDPQAQDARTNLGALLLARGDTAGALSLLREAVAGAPELAEAHYQLGLALDRTGATAAAAAELREAARLEPRMVAAPLALGNVLAGEGDEAGAADCFREAIRLDAGSAEARFAWGTLLAQQRRFPEAIALLREALNLDPAHVEARANLGNCELVTGDADAAIADFEQVLRAAPANAAVRENLAIAREIKRRAGPR
ncbi:MAG TPA: tetratricopeptide repeat protein [Opitutus sp.]|nr:tetratricopeptide repeat protein [Opitutus sp.]